MEDRPYLDAFKYSLAPTELQDGWYKLDTQDPLICLFACSVYLPNSLVLLICLIRLFALFISLMAE